MRVHAYVWVHGTDAQMHECMDAWTQGCYIPVSLCSVKLLFRILIHSTASTFFFLCFACWRTGGHPLPQVNWLEHFVCRIAMGKHICGRWQRPQSNKPTINDDPPLLRHWSPGKRGWAILSHAFSAGVYFAKFRFAVSCTELIYIYMYIYIYIYIFICMHKLYIYIYIHSM